MVRVGEAAVSGATNRGFVLVNVHETGHLQSKMVAWAGPSLAAIGLRINSPLFEPDFRYIFHWAFVGQACQSEVGIFLFLF